MMDGNFFLPDLEQKNSWRQIHTKFYGCKLRIPQRAAIVQKLMIDSGATSVLWSDSSGSEKIVRVLM